MSPQEGAAATAVDAADDVSRDSMHLREGTRKGRKLSIDYLLEGESIQTNPYLAAFAASGLPEVLRSDPNFFSWANIKGKVLRKEVAEASAAAARVPAAIAKTRRGRHDATAGDMGGGAEGHRGAVSDDAGPSSDGLGDGTGMVFFDLCSGKGFTSVLLAHRYPKARVLMFDKNAKMNLAHLKSLDPRVTFHRMDLYSDEMEATIRDAVAAHGTNGSAIVGVHLCGDLSRRAIELWDACGVDGLVLSPCCLVREVRGHRQPKGRFGYGLPRLARKTGWDAYKLWCLFLFNHVGVMRRASAKGEEGEGDGEKGERRAGSAGGWDRPGGIRRDLNWDDDMISDRNAFLCVSRGPGGDYCLPCTR